MNNSKQDLNDHENNNGKRKCVEGTLIAPPQAKKQQRDISALSSPNIASLDDNCLELILQYAADSMPKLLSICHAHPRFAKVLVDNSNCVWEIPGKNDGTKEKKRLDPSKRGIVEDLFKMNGHEGLVQTYSNFIEEEPQHFLQNLEFYEAVSIAGLFEKKKVKSHDPLLPYSVSRILELFRILDSFPLVKSSWEEGGFTKKKVNVVADIVCFMISCVGVLPDFDLVNWKEHCTIFMSRSKK